MGFVEKVIETLGPWNWWVLGLLLAGVEVLAPGSFFIWFALAAILVGTLALLVDLSWQIELVVFVVLAVVLLVAGRRFYAPAPADNAERPIPDRLQRLIGRTGLLDTAISGGSGHIRLDDTVWRVEGPDLPAGAKVRVCGVRDGRLQVEAS